MPLRLLDFFNFIDPSIIIINPKIMVKAHTEIAVINFTIIMCLAGINTVDIYRLKKEDYHDGIIGYERAKTRNARRDNAYIEMRVPGIILPLFEKYLDKTESPYLFNFHQRMTSSDSFGGSGSGGCPGCPAGQHVVKNNTGCCCEYDTCGKTFGPLNNVGACKCYSDGLVSPGTGLDDMMIK